MIGPPGAGKTILARRLPTIPPPLTNDEAIEVPPAFTASAGSCRSAIPDDRQAVSGPHHAVSPQALVGGWTFPSPGEASIAHLVLLLDELPEFRRDMLEALSQPTEEGRPSRAAVMPPNDCPLYGTIGSPHTQQRTKEVMDAFLVVLRMFITSPATRTEHPATKPNVLARY